MTKVFFPKEATIKIDAAADVTISAGTVLDTAFSSATAITGQIKDIDNVKSPVGDVEIIDLFGTDANGYQNAEFEEKPAPIAEFSGTVIIPGDELMESEIFGSGTSAGGTHTTYTPGKATRTKLAVLLNVDDGTDEVNWACTNAIMTTHESKFTGADGHLEASVTFKVLPRDWFGPQFLD